MALASKLRGARRLGGAATAGRLGRDFAVSINWGSMFCGRPVNPPSI